MKNKHSKLSIGIAILFEIIMITTAIYKIISGQWEGLFLFPSAIICTTLPFIITHIAIKKKILLPSSFEFISVLFILLALYFGEIMKVYTTFWWWDLFLHGMFGGYTVLVGLHLIQGIIIKEKDITEKRFTIFTIIFAFSFTITLGTLWEMIEFLADYFFKANMVNGGLEDTATDLLIKIFFAFITSIIWYYHKMKKK
jgi:putative membrane protein